MLREEKFVSKSVLKRLAQVEKKFAKTIQDIEERKNHEDIDALLRVREYFRKEREMNGTLPEIYGRERGEPSITEQWIAESKLLSPQQQEEKLQKQIKEVADKARAWLNSEERRQFDIKYAEFQRSQQSQTEPNFYQTEVGH